MRSFLFLATGFEEIEALTVVDVLRRGQVDALGDKDGVELMGVVGVVPGLAADAEPVGQAVNAGGDIVLGVVDV